MALARASFLLMVVSKGIVSWESDFFTLAHPDFREVSKLLESHRDFIAPDRLHLLSVFL